MLELPGATRKLPSSSAKRMRSRSLQLWEPCNPLGQALGWTATKPERRSFDGHWRRTPTKGTNTLCRSSKAYLPKSKLRATRALGRIDEALALAGETGEHWSDAFLHRLRGEILHKRDPANTAPAEEAFLTAIAVAQQQKARSFELRAALALAKLYQSTGRVADAHAVLASALKGFSPTPEFPEIAEAQTLLSALTS